MKQQSVPYLAADTRCGDTPVGVSPWSRAARVIMLGVFVGLALGALTRWIDTLPEGWRSLALIGAPWLGLAFALGALTVLWGGRGRSATLVGASATICTVLGYYGYMIVVEHQANGAYLAHYLTFWLVLALLGGALFGLAGAVWCGGQGRMKALAVGLLSAVCVGEGGWTTLRFLSAYHAVDVVPVLELALGVVLPLVLARAWRDRLAAYGTTIGLGLVGAICLRLLASLLTALNRP
ncbi:MAG: DUF6518 family protein [Chloroflexota bacterium]|nr:DUF6518 family protein [Chloroflexota bacterium]